ncbi:MAG TPA: hypothetical protein VK009_03395 [Chloroflexota bacterium]|nr:hypothetical protein [Chloroflexota bacterium]
MLASLALLVLVVVLVVDAPAAEALGDVVVDVPVVAPGVPLPKLTLPTASWTLSGGAGITGVAPLLVEVPALARGAVLLAAPVLETAPALAPVAPVAPVELVEVEVPLLELLLLAEQAGFDPVVVAPPEASAEGLAETDETGAVLAALDAAGFVLAAVLAPLTGLVLGLVLEALFPHAASTSDIAASVGKRGLGIIDSSAWPASRGQRLWS